MESSQNHPYKIRVLHCVECGLDFPFSVGEQQYFELKGFPPPKRCPSCRALRKQFRKQERNDNG